MKALESSGLIDTLSKIAQNNQLGTSARESREGSQWWNINGWEGRGGVQIQKDKVGECAKDSDWEFHRLLIQGAGNEFILPGNKEVGKGWNTTS